MSALAVLLVIASGALHASWNLFAKTSRSKTAFLWGAQLVGAIVTTPVAWLQLTRIGWDQTAIAFAASSMLLHGLYMWLLAKAYTSGDLSYVYPIVRGIGPFLVPVFGVALLGERLHLQHTVGLLVLLAGILWLNDYSIYRGLRGDADGDKPVSRRTLGLAVAVGLTVAAYTLNDKAALGWGGIEPLALNALSQISNALVLLPPALREGGIREEWKRNGGKIVLGAIFASGGYAIFLYALTWGDVARLAPMREIGTVFGTLFGIVLLREPQGARRIQASMLITAGFVLLGLPSFGGK